MEAKNLKRRRLTLEEKVKIIEFSHGRTQEHVANHFGLPRTSVSTILQNKNKILESSKNPALMAKRVIRKRDELIEKMEESLETWIELNTRYHVPLSTDVIKSNALMLYDELRDSSDIEPSEFLFDDESRSQEVPESEDLGTQKAVRKEFRASNGWFHNFVKRQKLRSIRLKGEAASADSEAAAAYPAELARIVQEGGYTAGQIFNADETGLLYKKIPSRTFLPKEKKVMPGRKLAKERVTLLFGGNSDGTLKLKPVFIHKSQRPRVFQRKNVNVKNLPFFYKSQKKAWMTAPLFEEWFRDEFKPEVEEYCKQRDLPFKILLLLDNAPGHPKSICTMFEEIKVIFLPPNTTSLLQPMDQGPIAIFKSFYLRNILRLTISHLDSIVNTEDKSKSLKEFWAQFNILDVIRLSDASWSEVSSNSMSAAWKKLFPDRAAAFCVQPSSLNNEVRHLSDQLNLDVSETPVEDFLDAHSEPLSDEDLLELEKENSPEDEEVGEMSFIEFSNKAAIQDSLQKLEKELLNLKILDGKFERISAFAESVKTDIKKYYNDL